MSITELSPLFDPVLTFSGSRINDSNQFSLLIRIHEFLTSWTENEDLSTYSATQVLCARMKAEWTLWEGYSKWDIGLNPFLGHFVEKWEAGERNGETLICGIILSGRANEVPFFLRTIQGLI